MMEHDPEDLPTEVVSEYGTFAMLPEALLLSTVSDVAVRWYGLLALHANRRTATTFVGYKAGSEILGKSKRTLMRASAELVEAGAIEITPRVVGGRRTSNLYRLRVMTPPSDTGVTAGGDTDVTTVTRTKRTRETTKASSGELATAKQITDTIYERDKLINYMAVVKLVQKALTAGEPRGRVEKALHGILDAGKPITGETLRLAIGRQRPKPRREVPPWEVE